jgi:hypothetical protein
MRQKNLNSEAGVGQYPRTDFSSRRLQSEASSRDSAATTDADDTARSFKAWSGRRQASRGDHGLARASCDNTATFRNPQKRVSLPCPR